MNKAEILKGLTETQKQVVINYRGKNFVTAVAGAGKTAVAVRRAAYMIEDGIKPENILMFTFTKKAANEMKQRVTDMVGSAAKGMTISTYHSFCCTKILRRYIEVLNAGWDQNFTVLDSNGSQQLLGRILKARGISDIEGIRRNISLYRKNLVTPEQAVREARTDQDSLAAEVYGEYQNAMRANNAVDFDSMNYLSVKILEQYPQVLDAVNKQYKWICTDETQDSSPSDIRLIELLAGTDWNLFMVGDIKQSIYSFRGSDIYALEQWIGAKGFKVWNMDENFRSTQNIVNGSDSVVSRDKYTYPSHPFTNNALGAKINVINCANKDRESSTVNKIIAKMVLPAEDGGAGLSYEDIAILYRLKKCSGSIEKSLLTAGIPYHVVGGLKFMEHAEVMDLLSYVRLIVNSNDEVAFERAVQVPDRFVGPQTVNGIFIAREDRGLYQTIEEYQPGNRRIREGLDNFMATYKSFCEYADEVQKDNDLTVADLIQDIMNKIGYRNHIVKMSNGAEDMNQRMEIIKELLSVACKYSDPIAFIDELISTDVDEESDGKTGVTLMTMHASKGLEFACVIMIDCNEGTIPFTRAVLEGNISEERRIWFVAMTRAKKYLFITRSQEVIGYAGLQKTKPSRFISEIKTDYVTIRRN